MGGINLIPVLQIRKKSLINLFLLEVILIVLLMDKNSNRSSLAPDPVTYKMGNGGPHLNHSSLITFCTL
jgi:hypothetical protein